MAEEFVQINVNVTLSDAAAVDRMMMDDAIDNRSAFIRRLIRQEWARRFSQPNPVISVADALLAGDAINKKEA
jgi:metal-responsive CopG/Arc/MetJ family transcriptional regulator